MSSSEADATNGGPTPPASNASSITPPNAPQRRASSYDEATEDRNLVELFRDFVLNVKVLGEAGGAAVPTIPIRVPQLIDERTGRLSFSKLIEIVIMIACSQEASATTSSSSLSGPGASPGRKHQYQVILTYPNAQTHNTVIVTTADELLSLMQRFAATDRMMMVVAKVTKVPPETASAAAAAAARVGVSQDDAPGTPLSHQKPRQLFANAASPPTRSPQKPSTGAPWSIPALTHSSPPAGEVHDSGSSRSHVTNPELAGLLEPLLEQLTSRMEQRMELLLQDRMVASSQQLKTCIEDTILIMDSSTNNNPLAAQDDSASDASEDDSSDHFDAPNRSSTAASSQHALERTVKDHMVSLELRFAKLEEQYAVAAAQNNNNNTLTPSPSANSTPRFSEETAMLHQRLDKLEVLLADRFQNMEQLLLKNTATTGLLPAVVAPFERSPSTPISSNIKASISNTSTASMPPLVDYSPPQSAASSVTSSVSKIPEESPSKRPFSTDAPENPDEPMPAATEDATVPSSTETPPKQPFASSTEIKMKAAIKDRMEHMEDRLTKLREINNSTPGNTIGVQRPFPSNPGYATDSQATTVVRVLFPADIPQNPPSPPTLTELESFLDAKLQNISDLIDRKLQGANQPATSQDEPVGASSINAKSPNQDLETQIHDLEELVRTRLDTLQEVMVASATAASANIGNNNAKDSSSSDDTHSLLTQKEFWETTVVNPITDLLNERMDSVEKRLNSLPSSPVSSRKSAPQEPDSPKSLGSELKLAVERMEFKVNGLETSYRSVQAEFCQDMLQEIRSLSLTHAPMSSGRSLSVASSPSKTASGADEKEATPGTSFGVAGDDADPYANVDISEESSASQPGDGVQQLPHGIDISNKTDPYDTVDIDDDDVLQSTQDIILDLSASRATAVQEGMDISNKTDPYDTVDIDEDLGMQDSQDIEMDMSANRATANPYDSVDIDEELESSGRSSAEKGHDSICSLDEKGVVDKAIEKYNAARKSKKQYKQKVKNMWGKTGEPNKATLLSRLQAPESGRPLPKPLASAVKVVLQESAAVDRLSLQPIEEEGGNDDHASDLSVDDSASVESASVTFEAEDDSVSSEELEGEMEHAFDDNYSLDTIMECYAVFDEYVDGKWQYNRAMKKMLAAKKGSDATLLQRLDSPGGVVEIDAPPPLSALDDPPVDDLPVPAGADSQTEDDAISVDDSVSVSSVCGEVLAPDEISVSSQSEYDREQVEELEGDAFGERDEAGEKFNMDTLMDCIATFDEYVDEKLKYMRWLRKMLAAKKGGDAHLLTRLDKPTEAPPTPKTPQKSLAASTPRTPASTATINAPPPMQTTSPRTPAVSVVANVPPQMKTASKGTINVPKQAVRRPPGDDDDEEEEEDEVEVLSVDGSVSVGSTSTDDGKMEDVEAGEASTDDGDQEETADEDVSVDDSVSVPSSSALGDDHGSVSSSEGDKQDDGPYTQTEETSSGVQKVLDFAAKVGESRKMQDEVKILPPRLASDDQSLNAALGESAWKAVEEKKANAEQLSSAQGSTTAAEASSGGQVRSIAEYDVQSDDDGAHCLTMDDNISEADDADVQVTRNGPVQAVFDGDGDDIDDEEASRRTAVFFLLFSQKSIKQQYESPKDIWRSICEESGGAEDGEQVQVVKDPDQNASEPHANVPLSPPHAESESEAGATKPDELRNIQYSGKKSGPREVVEGSGLRDAMAEVSARVFPNESLSNDAPPKKKRKNGINEESNLDDSENILEGVEKEINEWESLSKLPASITNNPSTTDSSIVPVGDTTGGYAVDEKLASIMDRFVDDIRAQILHVEEATGDDAGESKTSDDQRVIVLDNLDQVTASLDKMFHERFVRIEEMIRSAQNFQRSIPAIESDPSGDTDTETIRIALVEWNLLQSRLRETEEFTETYRLQVAQLSTVLEEKMLEESVLQRKVESLQRKLRDAHDREVLAQKQLRPVTKRVEQVIREMVDLEEENMQLKMETSRLRESLWFAQREC